MAEIRMGKKFHPGLVSVTFRQLPPRQIVDLSSQAGLVGIEWGGDVHVPHGDLTLARQVNQMTLDAGLRVAAYGSYYRVWPQEPAPFEMVLETALALGAPLIRVWAGKLGSDTADTTHWDMLVSEACRIAGLAATVGVRLAFEFHGGTLTDTDASARDLLTRAGHPNLGCYWQPRITASPAENVSSLQGVLPWLDNLHVFHWRLASDGTYYRRPLSEGQLPWLHYLTEAASAPGDRFAMLEFVRDDSPSAFLEDAAVLAELCREKG